MLIKDNVNFKSLEEFGRTQYFKKKNNCEIIFKSIINWYLENYMGLYQFYMSFLYFI